MIVNTGAGVSGASGTLAEDIAQLFAARGIHPQVVQPTAGKNLSALARDALDGGGEVIVAAGGDGTVSPAPDQPSPRAV